MREALLKAGLNEPDSLSPLSLGKPLDITGLIIEYEQGDLDTNGTLTLFSELIRSGQCWTLQGHYGRTARCIIDSGLISPQGIINWNRVEECKD